MLIRLLAAFILIPLVELYLLLQLADVTSLGTTLLLVIVTGVIGSFLARREGAMAWYRFRSAMAEGRMPSREIQDGLMIVFAAALLLTPGLITDFVGFSLLVPMGRNLFRKLFLARYAGSFRVQFNGSSDSDPMSMDSRRPEPLHRGQRGCTTVEAEAVERKTT